MFHNIVGIILVATACGAPKEKVIYVYETTSESDSSANHTESRKSKNGTGDKTARKTPAPSGDGSSSSAGLPVSGSNETSPVSGDSPTNDDQTSVDAVADMPTDRVIVARFAPESIYFNLYRNCGRCHEWTENEALVAQRASASLNRILSKQMPPSSPKWVDTDDGTALVNYLRDIISRQ